MHLIEEPCNAARASRQQPLYRRDARSRVRRRQRLHEPAAGHSGDDRVGPGETARQVRKKWRREKRHIAPDHHAPLGARRHKPGVDAGERPTARHKVRDDLHRPRTLQEGHGVPAFASRRHHQNLRGERPHPGDDVFDERPPPKGYEGLLASHAGRLPAGKDDRCDITCTSQGSPAPFAASACHTCRR